MKDDDEFFEQYMQSLRESMNPVYEKIGMNDFEKYLKTLSVDNAKIQRERAFNLCTLLINKGMPPLMSVIWINKTFYDPNYSKPLGITIEDMREYESI